MSDNTTTSATLDASAKVLALVEPSAFRVLSPMFAPDLAGTGFAIPDPAEALSMTLAEIDALRDAARAAHALRLADPSVRAPFVTKKGKHSLNGPQILRALANVDKLLGGVIRKALNG